MPIQLPVTPSGDVREEERAKVVKRGRGGIILPKRAPRRTGPGLLERLQPSAEEQDIRAIQAQMRRAGLAPEEAGVGERVVTRLEAPIHRAGELAVGAGAGLVEGVANLVIPLLQEFGVGRGAFPEGKLGLIPFLEAWGILGEAATIDRIVRGTGQTTGFFGGIETVTKVLPPGLPKTIGGALAVGGSSILAMRAEARSKGVELTNADYSSAVVQNALGMALGVGGSVLVSKALRRLIGSRLGNSMRHSVAQIPVGAAFGVVHGVQAGEDPRRIAELIVEGGAGFFFGSRLAASIQGAPPRTQKELAETVDRIGEEVRVGKIDRPGKPLTQKEQDRLRTIRFEDAREWAVRRIEWFGESPTVAETVARFALPEPTVRKALAQAQTKAKPGIGRGQREAVERFEDASQALMERVRLERPELIDEVMVRIGLADPIQAAVARVEPGLPRKKGGRRTGGLRPDLEKIAPDIQAEVEAVVRLGKKAQIQLLPVKALLIPREATTVFEAGFERRPESFFRTRVPVEPISPAQERLLARGRAGEEALRGTERRLRERRAPTLRQQLEAAPTPQEQLRVVETFGPFERRAGRIAPERERIRAQQVELGRVQRGTEREQRLQREKPLPEAVIATTKQGRPLRAEFKGPEELKRVPLGEVPERPARAVRPPEKAEPLGVAQTRTINQLAQQLGISFEDAVRRLKLRVPTRGPAPVIKRAVGGIVQTFSKVRGPYKTESIAKGQLARLKKLDPRREYRIRSAEGGFIVEKASPGKLPPELAVGVAAVTVGGATIALTDDERAQNAGLALASLPFLFGFKGKPKAQVSRETSWKDVARVIDESVKRPTEPLEVRASRLIAKDPKVTPAERSVAQAHIRGHERATAEFRRRMAARPGPDVELWDATNLGRKFFDWAKKVRAGEKTTPLIQDTPEYYRSQLLSSRRSGMTPKQRADVQEQIMDRVRITEDGIVKRTAKDIRASLEGTPSVREQEITAARVREHVLADDPVSGEMLPEEIKTKGFFKLKFLRSVGDVIARNFGPVGVKLNNMLQSMLLETDIAENVAIRGLSRIKAPGAKKRLSQALSNSRRPGQAMSERENFNRIMDFLARPKAFKGQKAPKAMNTDVAFRVAVMMKVRFGRDIPLKSPELRKSVNEAATYLERAYKDIANEALAKGLFLRLADGTVTPFQPWTRSRYWPVFLREEVFAHNAMSWGESLYNKTTGAFDKRLKRAVFLRDEIVKEVVEKTNATEGEVHAALNAYEQHSKGRPTFRATLDVIAKSGGHLEHARLLDTTVGIEWDPGIVFPRYVRPAILRFKFVDAFGLNGEKATALMEEAARQRYNADVLKQFFDVASEQSPDLRMPLLNSQFMKLVQQTAGFSTVARLGLSALAQWTQGFKIAQNVTWKDFARSFPEAVQSAIAESNIIPERIRRRFGNELLADFVAETGALRDAEHIRWISEMRGLTPKLGMFFLEKTGMAASDRFLRRWSALAGRRYVRTLAEEAFWARKTGNAKGLKKTRDFIRSLFPRESEEHAGYRRDMERWNDLKPERREWLLNVGGHTTAFRTQFRTRAIDLPFFADHPLLAPFYKFQTFGIRASAETYRVIMEAASNKPAFMRQLARFALFTLPGSWMIERLRKKARRPESTFWDDDGLFRDPTFRSWANLIAFSGMLTWQIDWFNSMASYQGLARRAVGPVYGTWFDFAEGMGPTIGGNWDPLKRVLIRQIPTTPLALLPEGFRIPGGPEIVRGMERRKPGVTPQPRKFVRQKLGRGVETFLFGEEKRKRKVTLPRARRARRQERQR